MKVAESIEEICPVFEPSIKHFILGDTNEQAQQEQSFLLSLQQDMSLSVHAIGLQLPRCGTYSICAVVIIDGSSTTTIGGSHIEMWKLTKVISLPVMREVTATLC